MKATSIVIEVTQQAKTAEITPELSLTPLIERLVFTYDGTKAYGDGEEVNPVFKVSTNQEFWDVVVTPEDSEEWLKVEKNGDNTGFTISTLLNNTSVNAKLTKVTVTAEKATPIVITVTQELKTLKIGDYFPDPEAVYKNGVLVSGTTAEGIVYWLDPEDASYNDGSLMGGITSGRKGKIVSLDEGFWLWSSIKTPIITNARDFENGMENMVTIQSLSENFRDYPAFEWVDAKNAPGTDYSSATKDVWYLPALNELLSLYEVWNGAPGDTEIDGMRTIFNDCLSSAGGAKITTDSYWTSTDTSSNGSTARVVPFRNGGNNYAAMKYQYSQRIRAIMIFEY